MPSLQHFQLTFCNVVLTWEACNVGVSLVPPEAVAGGAVGAGAALGVGAAAGEDEAGAHAVARVALLRVAAVRVRVALRPPDHCTDGGGHAIDDAFWT